MVSKRKKLKIDGKEKYEERKQIFASLTLYPGGLTEYERFVDYPCEVIDTKVPKKRIEWRNKKVPLMDYSQEFQERMIDEGIEALIHWDTSVKYGPDFYHTGVPVKKRFGDR